MYVNSDSLAENLFLYMLWKLCTDYIEVLTTCKLSKHVSEDASKLITWSDAKFGFMPENLEGSHYSSSLPTSTNSGYGFQQLSQH